MSATLNPEVATLKKLCLRNPVTLKLEEPELGEALLFFSATGGGID